MCLLFEAVAGLDLSRFRNNSTLRRYYLYQVSTELRLSHFKTISKNSFATQGGQSFHTCT